MKKVQQIGPIIPHIDFLGRMIDIGSEVVYPGRSGANLWMNYGIVQQLGADSHGTLKIQVRRIPMTVREKECLVWVEVLSRVVVVG